MKIDLTGNFLWGKKYGTDVNTTELFNILPTETGNFAYVASYLSNTQGYNYMLVEIDGTGDLIMAKSYASSLFGNDDDIGRDLLLIPGGGYYIFGHSKSYGNGGYDLHLIKTDLSGVAQWSATYANPDDLWASQLVLTSNNELIMTAQNDQFDRSGIDIVVIGCDISGNLQWSKRYGGDYLENQALGNHNTLIEVSSNLFVLFGKTSSFGNGQEDIYMIGFDRQGNVPCNVDNIPITVNNPIVIGNDIALPVTDFNPVVNTLNITPNPITLVDSILCPQQLPPRAFFEASDTTICAGDCIDFTDKSLQDPDQWNWSFEGASPDASAIQSPAGICYPDTGCFDVQLIVTNSGGQDALLIEDYICVYPYPEVFLGNDTNLCFNDTLLLEVPAGYNSYLWSTGATGQSIDVSSSGEYWVRVENQAACTGSDTISVDFNSFLVINLGPDRTICEGDSLILNAGSGFDSYLWQDGSVADQYIVKNTGEYWVEVADDLGCSGGDTVFIEVAENPVVSLGRDTTICEWDVYTLDGGEGFIAYLWQDGSTGRYFDASETAYYWVEAVDDNGCKGSDTAHIEVIDLPELFIGNDTSFCEDFNLYIDAGTGWDSYLWQDGSVTSAINATQYMSYWVTAEIRGCALSDTITINEDCPSLIWFPNSFTPNGDGINETFRPVYDHVDIFRIRIFDRWGQMVFTSDDIDTGWDGKLKGEICPVGAYVFIAEYTDNQKGEVIKVNGSVTLLH